jgi:hypothetical protein
MLLKSLQHRRLICLSFWVCMKRYGMLRLQTYDCDALRGGSLFRGAHGLREGQQHGKML